MIGILERVSISYNKYLAMSLFIFLLVYLVLFIKKQGKIVIRHDLPHEDLLAKRGGVLGLL